MPDACLRSPPPHRALSRGGPTAHLGVLRAGPGCSPVSAHAGRRPPKPEARPAEAALCCVHGPAARVWTFPRGSIILRRRAENDLESHQIQRGQGHEAGPSLPAGDPEGHAAELWAGLVAQGLAPHSLTGHRAWQDRGWSGSPGAASSPCLTCGDLWPGTRTRSSLTRGTGDHRVQQGPCRSLGGQRGAARGRARSQAALTLGRGTARGQQTLSGQWPCQAFLEETLGEGQWLRSLGRPRLHLEARAAEPSSLC